MADVPACMTWEPPTPQDDCHTWQRGRCGACGEARPLLLDHDHDTGLVRGYLCHRCNSRERTGTTPLWAAWRSGQNPATLLGIREQYAGWDTATYTAVDEDELRDAIRGLSA